MEKIKSLLNDTLIQEKVKKTGTIQNLMPYFNEHNLLFVHKTMPTDKAVGIDKITKDIYENNLTNNIKNLVFKLKKKVYKPLPVRRAYIPKSKEKKRPLGITAYEDRLVQAVMAEILCYIYEPLFLDCSFGFRPNRTCHTAIERINDIIINNNINYIVEADIKGFFDNVNHQHLIKMLKLIIKDRNFIFYVKKILKAGVVEDGQTSKTKKGTPQGGLISPILANVYLHYVLDFWFETYIKPKYKNCYLVRYADDFVALFSNEIDAKKYKKELKRRLAKYDLFLEPTKTKILQFSNNQLSDETFDFLGFTISNYMDEFGVVKISYTTSPKKYKNKKQNIKKLIQNMQSNNYYQTIRKINNKLDGFYNYYNIDTNGVCLNSIYNYALEQIRFSIKKKKIITSSIPLAKPNASKAITFL